MTIGKMATRIKNVKSFQYPEAKIQFLFFVVVVVFKRTSHVSKHLLVSVSITAFRVDECVYLRSDVTIPNELNHKKQKHEKTKVQKY